VASISGISQEYYEAAVLDGASKFQQAIYVTMPHLRKIITIMLIMSVGSLLKGDFGLFYNVTQNNGALYEVTDVIDTYIYRALKMLGDTGMSSAAGLYQSAVGFVLVLLANWVVTKIDEESAMF
jgi:putative aldouronate transport system permease protein